MYKIRVERDFFLNLQQMVKVIKPFCLDHNFGPKALSAPAPGLYIHVKLIKKWIYSKLTTNDQNDKAFLLTQNFDPRSLSAPARGYLHVEKPKKKKKKKKKKT